MKSTLLAATPLTALIVLAPASFGQSSNITAADKLSWSENCGWMNWRDAGSPVASQGVFVGSTILSGFVWCENVGWLNLGDGSPTDGTSYANLAGADFGVNVDPGSGALSGLAWGENIGWVNFTLPSLPPNQQARLDKAADRLRGYAWGENIGWINLDSNESGKFVGVHTCSADFNGDGFVNPDDLADFITCFFLDVQFPGTCPEADFNGDGFRDPDDLADFITAFFLAVQFGC